jgi:hypothetical protein
MTDDAEAQRRFVEANDRAAHAEHVMEYPAGRFYLSPNGQLVRIAFGQLERRGPDGQWQAPRYHVAVSMPPAVAISLRDWLLKWYPVETPAHQPGPQAAEDRKP